MGCDGGSIPRRDELVKLKKKQEKPDPNEVERIKWSSCAISKEPLKEPIVADELGFLFNKEAVIRNLLEKTMDESFKHIRSLKDLTPVRFTPNPALAEKEKSGDDTIAPFICPITLIEVGHHRFSLIKSCGCVLSERALREIPSPTCLQCGTPFTNSDVIPLNPSEKERVGLKKLMLEHHESEKLEKRESRKEKSESKKEKKRDRKANDKAFVDEKVKLDTVGGEQVKTKAQILAEREALKKRPLETTTSEPPAKAQKSGIYASIFTSSIKPVPGERMQETFMCRNVLRG